MQIALTPRPTNALHSSEDTRIVQQLSPRETEGQLSVGRCFLDMDPALEGAAPTENFHWKMTIRLEGRWRWGDTHFLNLSITHLHIFG